MRPQGSSAVDLSASVLTPLLLLLLCAGLLFSGIQARGVVGHMLGDLDAQRALIAQQLSVMKQQLETTKVQRDLARDQLKVAQDQLAVAQEQLALARHQSSVADQQLEVARQELQRTNEVLAQAREINRKMPPPVPAPVSSVTPPPLPR